MMDWDTFAIEDLRLVMDETIDDDELLYCIYSFSLDAVTYVDEVTLQKLKLRGIQDMQALPDSSS
jgi:hypothetical protein